MAVVTRGQLGLGEKWWTRLSLDVMLSLSSLFVQQRQLVCLQMELLQNSNIELQEVFLAE
jgi:hypothetical protein